jgi:hypothetical protein
VLCITATNSVPFCGIRTASMMYQARGLDFSVPVIVNNGGSLIATMQSTNSMQCGIASNFIVFLRYAHFSPLLNDQCIGVNIIAAHIPKKLRHRHGGRLAIFPIILRMGGIDKKTQGTE